MGGTQNLLEAAVLMARACYSVGEMQRVRTPHHGKTFSWESPGNYQTQSFHCPAPVEKGQHSWPAFHT